MDLLFYSLFLYIVVQYFLELSMVSVSRLVGTYSTNRQTKDIHYGKDFVIGTQRVIFWYATNSASHLHNSNGHSHACWLEVLLILGKLCLPTMSELPVPLDWIHDFMGNVGIHNRLVNKYMYVPCIMDRDEALHKICVPFKAIVFMQLTLKCNELVQYRIMCPSDFCW